MDGDTGQNPGGAGRTHSPPRIRLPLIPSALDTSEDSAGYASREYRIKQAKRRRRGHRARRAEGASEQQEDPQFPAGGSGRSAEPGTAGTGRSGDQETDLSVPPTGSEERPYLADGDHSITDELEGLGEDLVPSGSELPPDTNTTDSVSFDPDYTPQPVTRLYVDKGDKFHVTKSRGHQPKTADVALGKKSQACAVDLALQTQKIFAPLGRLCSGLLAGISVGHWVFVLSLTRDQNQTMDFVAHYSRLALPFRAVFFTLSVLCAVASLDRYDAAAMSGAQLRRSATLQDAGIVMPVYLAVLALSTCLAPLDDKFHLYGYNRSAAVWWKSGQDVRQDAQQLVVLCGVRAGLALLAWLLISVNPALDRVLRRLHRLKQQGAPAGAPLKQQESRQAEQRVTSIS